MIFIVNKNREAMDSELKSMPVSERAREGRGRHRQKGQRWGVTHKKDSADRRDSAGARDVDTWEESFNDRALGNWPESIMLMIIAHNEAALMGLGCSV
jgi:hypothetical protein